MNQQLALRILSDTMKWDNRRSTEEFAWLQLIARMKYDGYRDYSAGLRFVECLVTWLKQFEEGDREAAYGLVKSRMVYIGSNEMQRIVEQFYHRSFREFISTLVSGRLSIPSHECLINKEAQETVQKIQRETLFMALSDGARIDVLRHANSGNLSNEQLVVSVQPDTEKWGDLLGSLRKDRQDQTARFSVVYLIDDFVGTGTSFLRRSKDAKSWSGKLVKFKNSLKDAIVALEGQSPLNPDWILCVHHYIGTESVVDKLRDRLALAMSEMKEVWWAKEFRLSFGMTLPSSIKIDKDKPEDTDIVALTNKYYDESLRTAHTDVGGEPHLGLGFGACGLPLVLEHNTPNNSIPILWADTKGGIGSEGVKNHRMRPLFRRRQRHA